MELYNNIKLWIANMDKIPDCFMIDIIIRMYTELNVTFPNDTNLDNIRNYIKIYFKNEEINR